MMSRKTKRLRRPEPQQVKQPSQQSAQNNKSASRKNALSRYQRKKRQDTMTFIFSLAGIVIVGLLAFLMFHIFSAQDTMNTPGTVQLPGATPSSKSDQATAVASAIPSQKQSSPWENQEFVTATLSDTASKLHLTLDQLSSDVQGGKQISDVAAQQGFSADQLHTIELASLQVGLNKLVSTGQMTQDDAMSDMQHWQQRDPQRLNGDFTYALGGVPSLPNVTPTVVAK